MTFIKGSRKPTGSGRKAGVQNKTTREVREALREAFDRRGGVEYLVRLPDEIFVRLLVRLIPTEIAMNSQRPLKVRVDYRQGVIAEIGNDETEAVRISSDPPHVPLGSPGPEHAPSDDGTRVVQREGDSVSRLAD